MFGYMGQILRVDLTNGRVSKEALKDHDCKMFLGGSGLATKYLFDEVPKGTDPLGPKNKLIFMTGPLTGTESPSAGRYCVVTKSPLTGFWGEANSGGTWGVYLKKSGFDGIIFEGISPKPVYLVIDDGKAELRDAKHLWGKSVGETTRLIKEQLAEDFNVACIGIAGENLVRYAGIFNDSHRPAGRCGVGAVMGSKHLKAVAAKGTQEIKIAKKDAFSQISRRNYDLVNESLLKITLETYGTAMVTDLVNVRGGFPTRNWQTGVVPDIDKISGVTLANTLLVDRKHCYACPISCCRVSVVKSGPYACKGEGPEYETIGAFGAMCALESLEAVTLAHNLCDDYGLDVVSTGSTIAFAIECYEKGILTKADTDGLELKFGDADMAIKLIHKIAKREGIGALLAEGTKRVAAKLDKGAERFAMHVKGLELPAYDPRAAKICGLAFATANRGGDHITAYVEGPAFVDIPFPCIEDSRIEDWIVENPAEAKIVKDLEDALTVFDCAGTCKFMGMALATQEWVDMIVNCVGWEFTVTDFRKAGERVYNLARAFNVRDGLTRADDTLPKRLLEEPLPEGAAQGHTVKKLDQSLDVYYELRGWDKTTGKPTPQKLRELNLDYVINQIIGGEIAVTTAEKPWLKQYKMGPYRLPHTKEPYPKITVHSILDATAAEFPDKAACFYLGKEVLYSEMKLLSDRLAAALADLGVKKGDRVATVLPNCPQFMISDFGIMKTGAAHVPCSVMHKAADLMYEIGESGAETVICTEMSLDTVNSIRDKTRIKNIIVTSMMDYSSEEPAVKKSAGAYQFRDLIASHEAKPPDVDIDPMKDLAVLPFTGGATGLPKGVMLTHYNRVVAVTQMAWAYEPLKVGMRGKVSGMIPIPLFHAYGHLIMQFGVYWGLKCYLLPDPRDIDTLVQMLMKYRPFFCACVPTQYSRLVAAGLGKITTMFISTTAALAPEIAQKFRKETGVPVTEAYGLTETGGGTHMNLSSFSKITGFMPFEKFGSIGIPMPDTDVKIMNLDTGEEAAPGQEGELWVRGPQMMIGYWPDVGKGLVDGWLPTGDVVKMEEDGYFYITDRIKDMANISGLKVYTRLVDDALYEHPAVGDAVAIGIPDPERPGSERIKAFIRLKREFQGKVTAEEIINHCREKLPPYAVPKFIEFREELPLTVTLKLFKRQLREEEIAKMKASGELK